MSRAAEGLAQIAAARLVERDGRTVVALIGAGDNGGDTLAPPGSFDTGFACAVVLLPEPGGWGCTVRGSRAAELAGVSAALVAAEEPAVAARVVAEGDLVLDGIVGIGGGPASAWPLRPLADAIADDAWVIAVDVASGLDPDGVDADDDAVWADETVTFGAPKPAHLLPAGRRRRGPAHGRRHRGGHGRRRGCCRAADLRRRGRASARAGPRRRQVLPWRTTSSPEARPTPARRCCPSPLRWSLGRMVRYVGTPTPTGLVRGSVPEAVIGEGQVQAWVVGPGLDPESTGEEAAAQLRWRATPSQATGRSSSTRAASTW